LGGKDTLIELYSNFGTSRLERLDIGSSNPSINLRRLKVDVPIFQMRKQKFKGHRTCSIIVWGHRPEFLSLQDEKGFFLSPLTLGTKHNRSGNLCGFSQKKLYGFYHIFKVFS
jgi:hypothetical protein